MMAKFIFGTLIGVTLGCTPKPTELNLEQIEKARRLDVQGHRGARSTRPENTIPAFEYALEVGVDTLEFDLAVTKDQVLILHHDLKINRDLCQYESGDKIEEDLWVYELTLDEIKEFDCGSLPNPRFPEQKLFPGTPIPTLAEVFKWIQSSPIPQSKKVRFNIETKSDPENSKSQPDPATYAKLFVDMVNKYKLAHRVTMQSFDHRTLQEAHKIAPQLTKAALFENRPKNLIADTQKAKAQIISPNHRWLRKSDVTEAHSVGLKVIPWTANEVEEWIHLIDMGVDGIITDDPAPLLELLGRSLVP